MAQNYFGKTDSRGSTPVTYNFTPLSSAEPFSTSKPYAVGDYVFYEGVLYRCKTDKAAGAWAPTKFEEANLGEHLTEAEKALLTKAEIDGYYDGMTVGNAEQIVGTVFEEDDTAYNYRTTGGSAEVGDRAYVDAIVGGSLVFNQLMPIPTASTSRTQNGVTFTDNRDGSYTFYTDENGATAQTIINIIQVVGAIQPKHVHLVLGNVPHNYSTETWSLMDYYNGVLHWETMKSGTIEKVDATGLSRLDCRLLVGNGTVISSPITVRPQVFDLTAMFGATIADYIYALETAHAGDGVAWFKRYFPKPYYAYHPVGMEHVNAVAAKTVGFNQFDKSTIVEGYIDDANGELTLTSGGYKSTDFIRVIGGASYYIKTDQTSALWGAWYNADKQYIAPLTMYKNQVKTAPSNACYTRFTVAGGTSGGNVDTLCISIHWDNSRDGDYEPYNLHTYPLADLTLRGVPLIDESGNLKFDGDKYKPDGTVERRWAEVDLGTLDWAISSKGRLNSSQLNDAHSYGSTNNEYKTMLKCSKYEGKSELDEYNLQDKGIMIWVKTVYIYDSDYTDPAAFKAAMSGVKLIYLLNTPTTEEADPYQYPMVVDNWGTEELIDGKVESGDRDVAIPVGHETKYPPNLKDKLESAANNPDADGAYVLTHDGGSNTYTPLASNATIQNIIARLEALEGGGE